MTEKYRVTQTRYLGDQMLASAGEVVYLYPGNDMGEARKESDKTGFLYISVTKDPAGNSGSFTMQVGHLLRLDPHPVRNLKEATAYAFEEQYKAERERHKK